MSIYADHAHAYRHKGFSPLPLPTRSKTPPPTGYTGYAGRIASGADIQDWADNGHAGGNIGLRLPETVLGLDLDDYDGKPGLATMLEAVERLGALPKTWTSTSRPGTASGIRFYRVPAGRMWADVLGSGVEIIHYGHRYAVGAPSIHPEGRPYGWTNPEGQACEAPKVDEFPELPPEWVADLDRGDINDRAGKADLTGADVREWLAALPEGEPCQYVTRLLSEASNGTEGNASRHDYIRGYSAKMVRAGDQGHHGVGVGLDSLHSIFLASLKAGKARAADAGEWARMVSGAVALAAKTPTAEVDKGCCGSDSAMALKAEAYMQSLASPDAHAHAADTDKTGSKPTLPSAATLLVRLALDRYRLGISTGGEPFAVPLDGNARHIARLLRGGQGSLRAELADVYFDQFGKAAPQTALADAMIVLEGKASKEAAELLSLRVAETDGALWLDLGRTDGRMVKITGNGWGLADDCPVLFHRTALTAALPEPAAGGNMGQLWSLLNVAEDFRPLILACQIAALFPSIPHPVMSLHGEQGTGKTTASKRLAGILDPSPAQVRKAPRDVESWVTAAAGSWFVALDNLSHIPDWLSDALCRASTGDADVRRTLYTDGGLTVFAFRRVVILNGIDLGSLNGDLVDRLVAIHLEVIPEAERRREDELEAAWIQAHPRILGALLDVAARVLAERPGVKLDGYPRMADFAHILATVDHVTGTSGFATYLGLRDDLAQDALAADPALAAIAETVTTEFVGTAKDLLEAITPGDDRQRLPKAWPKSARSLTTVLTRNSPTLRRLGWTVEKTGEKDDRQRADLWRLVPFEPLEESASEGASETASEQSHSHAHSQSHSHPGTPADLHKRQNGEICERNERDLHTYSVDLERDKREADTDLKAEGTSLVGPYLPLASLAPSAEAITDFTDLLESTPNLPTKCAACGADLYLQDGRTLCERCRLDAEVDR